MVVGWVSGVGQNREGEGDLRNTADGCTSTHLGHHSSHHHTIKYALAAACAGVWVGGVGQQAGWLMGALRRWEGRRVYIPRLQK